MYYFNDDKHCNNHKMHVHYKQFCDERNQQNNNEKQWPITLHTMSFRSPPVPFSAKYNHSTDDI